MSAQTVTVRAARKFAQRILLVTEDGEFGPLTLKAWLRLSALASTSQWSAGVSALDARKQMQLLLHVAEDGIFGSLTAQAWTLLGRLHESAPWPGETPEPDGDGWHYVNASSFADPEDITAFRACKLRGKSDKACFAVGDNGIGKWGDDCTADRSMCALPPEYWAQFGAAARGKLVEVQPLNQVGTFLDPSFNTTCELRDTMPHLANITNGAGIDLNPAAVAEIGKRPPMMTRVRWRWKTA
jgi:hypothetical protein